MPTDLSNRFLRVVEAAAIAAARTMGNGERKRSDHVAVEAMRRVLADIPMRGRIVIGEGERDEAPMLHIGEELGTGGADAPRIDIAVDPLEGTNLCASGAHGAIAVLAASEEGGLLHAPDSYMQKLVVGPRARGRIDLDAPVRENLQNIADSMSREIEDLLIVVLDRPRHHKLMADIRAAGARIRLITDGDLAPGISACITGTGVHAVMGIGAAPEGVITAAAVRCLGGEMQGRLVEASPTDRARAAKMGIADFDQRWTETMLAPGERLIVAATGVTDAPLVRGVTFFGNGCRTHSVVMGLEVPRRIRFVDTIHVDDTDDLEVRM
ncbi:MAG: class II fructose-bisphosphatase [Planctomycetota bacterium]|nr:class II fructose-bisphosphatase [Planctomycetota bacterium]